MSARRGRPRLADEAPARSEGRKRIFEPLRPNAGEESWCSICFARRSAGIDRRVWQYASNGAAFVARQVPKEIASVRAPPERNPKVLAFLRKRVELAAQIRASVIPPRARGDSPVAELLEGLERVTAERVWLHGLPLARIIALSAVEAVFPGPAETYRAVRNVTGKELILVGADWFIAFAALDVFAEKGDVRWPRVQPGVRQTDEDCVDCTRAGLLGAPKPCAWHSKTTGGVL